MIRVATALWAHSAFDLLHEIADMVRFALQWRCVRRVTFKPIHLCSLGVSAAVLMQRPPGLLDVVNLIVTVGLFGGLPFALGVGLFLIGWRQSRK
jgi:hypothetical protein